jgi:hypothetical protein
VRLTVALLVVGAAASAAACNPTSPNSPALLIPSGTHQSPLVAIAGQGAGGVSVTSTAIPEGTMRVEIKVVVADLRPNTAMIVQRAPDVGRTLTNDGVCQRALGLAPWSPGDPPAPVFPTFPLNGGLATLTTDGSGAGTLTFEFRSPAINAGTVFDVMFRLVDNETAPTTELRSGCFQVAVQ